MVWFKLDDRFHSHPKLLRLRSDFPRTWQRSVSLWTVAASWCSEHERDGRVPDSMLGHFGATQNDARQLQAVGLWARIEPDEWLFHDWEVYQPSSTKLRREREEGATRARRSREARSTKAPRSPDEGVENGKSPGKTPNASANGSERVRSASLTRPDPTRPSSSVNSSHRAPTDGADSALAAELDTIPLSPSPKLAGMRWWSDSFNAGGGAPPMFDRAYEVIGSKTDAERALVAQHVNASQFLRDNKRMRNPDHVAKWWDRYVEGPGDELKSVARAQPLAAVPPYHRKNTQ